MEITADKVIEKANLNFYKEKGRYLNVYTKKLLVSALIQCHYDYACSSWCLGLTKQTKQRLQINQNKIIKNVLNLSPRTHIGANEFQEVNWLPINYRVFQIIVNRMFRILNDKSPIYLQEVITKSSRIHTHSTRSGALALFKPRMGTHGQKNFSFQGHQFMELPPYFSAITTMQRYF